jgi:hypothetical protein
LAQAAEGRKAGLVRVIVTLAVAVKPAAGKPL